MRVYSKSKRLPPGPEEKYDLNGNRESLDHMIRLIAAYGDVVKVQTNSRQHLTYIVNEPDCIHHVLVANQDNYISGVGVERVQMLLGKGLFVSQGDFWRRQRALIQPAFSRSSLADLIETIRLCTMNLDQEWARSARLQEPINLTKDVSGFALEVIVRSIFGDDYEAMSERPGAKPFGFLKDDPARNLATVMKFRQFDSLILEVIEKRRRRGPGPSDLLAAMMDARDGRSGQGMSDHELLDEVKTLIVAGHETTAGTLNWVWYLFSEHPPVEQALQQEIQAVGWEGNINLEKVSQLRYMRQVLQETLRLYPPGWLLTRKALAEDEIAGYRVPAGTDIFLSPYLVHRHPGFWSHPEQFDPDRFRDEGSHLKHRGAYIPFSAGLRRCIGEHFSFLEMQIHLCVLFERYRLRYIQDKPIELDLAVNLRTRHDLYMTIRPRT